MSEEEMKAIEELKQELEKTIRANNCGLSNNDFKKEINTYKKILNLIENQQKEIEELKINSIPKLKIQEKIINYLEILNCEYPSYKKEEARTGILELYKNQQKEIELKDKVIDEMAKMINKAYFDENNFNLWFEKEICPENNCFSDRINRINQYFKVLESE